VSAIVASELAVSSISDAEIETVVALWQRCDLTQPWTDPAADIAFARRGPNSDILVGRCGDKLVATALVGHDGHRGWVYYVAVDPDAQGSGLGRAIMSAAEDWLRAHGVLKVQLMVRPDNSKVQAFYEALGYGEQKRIIYAKWLDGRVLTP
jgi:ribosomal protein S18 acetylase RimI-like enzyme